MPARIKTMRRSPAKPQVIRALSALRAWTAALRERHETVALVPTMGALHAGHLSLVRTARRRCDRVIVSIFVNPTQFAPGEDFTSYPRTWEADLEALSELSVDVVWAPPVGTMYPAGFATQVVPGGPAVVGLEDRFRPQFFGGVCTVVAKLITQTGADIATFGEKDYQQLKVVTAMARDLDLPVRIVSVPTVREKDGLALSSRNAYLAPAERVAAPTLHRVLKDCSRDIKAGRPVIDVLAVGRAKIERQGFAIDYLEARHADTLMPLASPGREPIRLLVAARIGRTRLIDNVGV
jgi:pantoate--beta-alanine ligase